MRHTNICFVCVILVVISSAMAQKQAQSIDPVIVSPDMFTVLLDNEHVRVVTYRIEPGERDEWHTHPPKVSYIVSGGTLRITLDDGSSFLVDEKSDTATWMDHVGRHYAENVGDSAVKIVLVEVKSASEESSE